MIPQIGQHVKCILRAGVVAEGIVEEWGTTAQLRSLDGENILIITHPTDDIVLIKITVKSPIKNKISSNLENEFKEIHDQPSNNDLRLKQMVELKALLLEQEKKIITDKLKDHSIGEVKKAKYEYPGFLAQQGSKQHT